MVENGKLSKGITVNIVFKLTFRNIPKLVSTKSHEI